MLAKQNGALNRDKVDRGLTEVDIVTARWLKGHG